MKIVVAGGSGLIGRHLVLELTAAGHDVVVLSRSEATVVPGARTVGWVPGSAGPWSEELGGADAIVNLAGENIGARRWTGGRKRRLRDSRLKATRSLVETMGQLAPERRPSIFLNASGTDIYDGIDEAPAAEDSAAADTFLARLCLDWEAEAMRAADLGVRVVCLRFGIVVAPGAPSLERMALPFRLMLGGPVGSGQQWISWVAVDDVIGMARWSLDDERVSGILNVASPDAIQQSEFAAALGRALARPSWLRTPAWVVRLALGELAVLALGSRRVRPAKALELGYSFRRPDIDAALAAAFSDPDQST